MKVYEKLMQARIALQETALTKTGLNKFAGYKYFELADFLPVVQKIFKDLGLCGVVSYEATLATLTITCIEDLSQLTITSPMGSAALKGVHEVQNIGAVETYQRRYLWVTAMEIVEHDALDSAPPQKDSKGIPASFKSSPTMGALDNVSSEDLAYLQDLALNLTEGVAAGASLEVWQKLEGENLDVEQKTALWTMLDSKTRSAIKAAKPQ